METWWQLASDKATVSLWGPRQSGKTTLTRAIRKEKKVYLFDPVTILEPGPQFENRVALELWRAVSTWNDRGWGDFDLHFVRNKEKEEVDFLISSRDKPFLLIETKLSDDTVSKSLLKFQTLLGVPGVHLVNRRGAGPRAQLNFLG